MNVLLDTVRFLDHNAFPEKLNIYCFTVFWCPADEKSVDALILLPLKFTFLQYLEACKQISLSSEFRSFTGCMSLLLLLLLLFLPNSIFAFLI